MATRKKVPAVSKSANPSNAFHRLDALLHTMRCIAQQEDSLCELAHDVKRSGKTTPETIEDLRLLLDRIPYHDYMHDLDAVRDLLGETSAVTKPAKAPAKKGARSRKSARL